MFLICSRLLITVRSMDQNKNITLKKGRGAVTNATGRYERLKRESFDDGWGSVETRTLEPLRTEISRDSSRSVIARNTSPDIPFDQSVNPYRGCEHGCVYCFARPSHAWLGLSAGLDFETKLTVKPDAAECLERELAKPSYRPKTLALGTNTDPYQPVERHMKVTRGILQVLRRARHPVTIVTKSNLILRDLDILEEMALQRLASVMISVTTLDRTLARKMEPRAPTPERRIQAITGLSAAGVPTGVLAAPMIPALNDAELETILERCSEAGAGCAGYVLLRLPLEIKDLFEEWLDAHFPDRKTHILNLVRQTRGGRLYDSAWGLRQKGTGVYADLLKKRFSSACKRLGLNRNRWDLDTTAFRPPDGNRDQLKLF